MIQEAYNFNDPLVVTVIFREPVYEEGSSQINELKEELGIVTMSSKVKDHLEYSGSVGILWENVLAVKSFPYKDDWKSLKGPKYYLEHDGHEQDMLILGDYDKMMHYWTMFRNRYKKYR